MDLTSEDFQWVTKEIMRIADICCNGRLVSVLEGGYGSTVSQKPKQKNSSSFLPNVEGAMNREVLADSVVAHIQKLVDPYDN